MLSKICYTTFQLELGLRLARPSSELRPPLPALASPHQHNGLIGSNHTTSSTYAISGSALSWLFSFKNPERQLRL